MRLFHGLTSHEDFSTWTGCENYGEHILFQGIRPKVDSFFVSSAGIYLCKDNDVKDDSDPTVYLDKILSGLNWNNLEEYCMPESKGANIAHDAIKKVSILRNKDKRQLVNVGLLRETISSITKKIQGGNVTDCIPIPDDKINDMLDEL